LGDSWIRIAFALVCARSRTAQRLSRRATVWVKLAEAVRFAWDARSFHQRSATAAVPPEPRVTASSQVVTVVAQTGHMMRLL
jgi:hypothetical protein